MRNRITQLVPFFAAILVVVLCMTGKSAQAEDYKIGPLTIENPWARASAGMARAGASFMLIKNTDAAGDKLVSAEADVSKVVELHTHVHDNGVMRMRKVDSIAVPGNGEANLKPGGLHVMFIGLHKPLVKGETFDVKLNFAKSGSIVSPVTVRGVGAR